MADTGPASSIRLAQSVQRDVASAATQRSRRVLLMGPLLVRTTATTGARARTPCSFPPTREDRRTSRRRACNCTGRRTPVECAHVRGTSSHTQPATRDAPSRDTQNAHAAAAAAAIAAVAASIMAHGDNSCCIGASSGGPSGARTRISARAAARWPSRCAQCRRIARQGCTPQTI